MNAIRCMGHNHGIGYSCAVDTFLEIYHYGIFCQERLMQFLEIPFIAQLNVISRARNSLQDIHVSCRLREDIWDMLVSMNPRSFSPKGTINAEIDAAFQTLIDSAPNLLGLNFSGVADCFSCKLSKPLVSHINLLQFCQSVNNLVSGQFDKGIELQIQKQARIGAGCQECVLETNVKGSVEMPSFLFVELGLHNDRNVLQPPTTISQEMCIFGIPYRLTAAVVKDTQHFLAIVSVASQYVITDDLSSHVEHYPTFSAAVF